MALKFQGKLITLIDCKRVLKAFTEKHDIFQRNIQKKEFHNISELAEIKDSLTEEDPKNYCSHLSSFKQDMNHRFPHLFSFEEKPWIVDHFTCDIHFAHEQIQEELIELKCNESAKYRYKL